LTIDLQGHGDSDVSADPISLETMADDCVELISTVGGPCVVGGCSMGSAVAQVIASRMPNFLQGAIFANGSGPRVAGAGRTDVIEQRAQLAEHGMPGIAEDNLKRWFTDEFRLKRPDVVSGVLDILLTVDPHVHAQSWRALAARSDNYDRIRVPALVIGASKDVSAKPESVRALASALPDATFRVIEGAGHFAAMEKPEDFAALVLEFFQERGLMTQDPIRR
jgi:pimeloyl-ACP methyl ester carboxylesterase